MTKEEQQKAFKRVFNNCVANLEDDLIYFRDCVLEESRDPKYGLDFDMGSFAKEAFLQRLKSFHDFHAPLEDILRQATDLLNDKEE